MRKFDVYSFFDSHNIGDVLIANQVKKLFSGLENVEFFDISSGKPAELCGLKKFAPRSKKSFKSLILKTPILRSAISLMLFLKRRHYKAIADSSKNSEIVVFAGGNVVMELNKLPLNILSLYLTARQMKKNYKKVCFCFCGMGPFANKSAERIASKLLGFADFISVRDRYSFDIAKKLVPEKNIEIWPDPVLMLSPEKEIQPKCDAFGINSYFGHTEFQKIGMYNAYIACIKSLREKYPNIPVYLFSSELTDIENIKLVKEHFVDDSLVVVQNIKSSEELFEFYDKVAVVLGVRMHTVITATISGLPVVSVAWQSKVSSVMELLGNSDLNFNAAEFIANPDKAVEALEKCLKEKTILISKTNSQLSEIKNNNIANINNFITLMEENNGL